MGDIIIKVRVPDNKDSFKKLVEDIIKHYDRKSNIMNIIEELKGIIKTRKSWGRLKNEYYEQKKPFIK